jgi:hypothetical protein
VKVVKFFENTGRSDGLRNLNRKALEQAEAREGGS